MNFDELHYRKIENFKNEIVGYINEVYLKEIKYERMDELIKLLDAWDKDRDMIEKIAVDLAIEGNLTVKEINKTKLNKEISKILFEEYVEGFIQKTQIDTLKLCTETKINIRVREVKVKVALKEYIRENVINLFNKDIKYFKNNVLTVEEDRNKIIIKRIQGIE
ncbi:hypothetical protein [uncultured Clostridium sp.]|uniref:hypothetical protein n=1 Tax=uncultured Clostridium sp. TaxID=59620 RepID=UPI0026062978|nr:hypothetical protein [uncultured Clostridium sp.]